MYEVIYDNVDGTVGVTIKDGIALLHLDNPNIKWSLSTYKSMINKFVDILEVLSKKGINVLYTICHSPKAVKFNQMFGFTVFYIDPEYTIMRLENVWE